MKRSVDCTIHRFRYVAAALLLAGLTTPAFAQQNQSSSSDADHVTVSSSGALQDARQNQSSSSDADTDGNGQAIFSSPLILQNARQSQSSSSGVDRVISSNPDSLQDVQPNQSSGSSVNTVISDPGAMQGAQQEQSYNGGIVDDWTHYHVIFSNPGTLEDALKKGKYGEWQNIMNDPRYQMQQVRRNSRSIEGMTSDTLGLRGEPIEPPFQHDPPWQYHDRRNARNRRAPLHGDWIVSLRGGGSAISVENYPAKYTFSPIQAASCANDFVVFPIDAPGASNQANILGVSNLYSTTCTGTIPTVKFAYFVGSGSITTSPVLSEDGTKVAFVESITGNGNSTGSIFHVLKLGTNGNTGCPSSSPCNGASFGAPVAPGGTLNNAVDTKITMNGFVSNTRSSPFVDYQHDIAYVGDDSGKVHKFTGVFQGTPAEVTTSPWPFTVASGAILTSPVFDGGTSQNIFVGGSNGLLYCITSTGAHCSTASITAGTGPVLAAPVVDSTQEKVFAVADSSTNAVLTQATTSLGSQVSANVGASGSDFYDGSPDNAYFTTGTGYYYVCGNLTGAATPALWRVPITSGTMSSANDGHFFQLVITGNTGPTNDCSPITEFYNASQGKDYLFLGVKGPGFATIANGGTAPDGTPACNYTQCIISFSLPTSSPFTFPSAANAVSTTNISPSGVSGIIIDNPTNVTGASQIYFRNIGAGSGVQESQSALQ